jgi:hypothetical protein
VKACCLLHGLLYGLRERVYFLADHVISYHFTTRSS